MRASRAAKVPQIFLENVLAMEAFFEAFANYQPLHDSLSTGLFSEVVVTFVDVARKEIRARALDRTSTL